MLHAKVIDLEKNPDEETVSSVTSGHLFTISHDASTREAIRLMEEKGVRQLAVRNDKGLLGAIRLGDILKKTTV